MSRSGIGLTLCQDLSKKSTILIFDNDVDNQIHGTPLQDFTNFLIKVKREVGSVRKEEERRWGQSGKLKGVRENHFSCPEEMNGKPLLSLLLSWSWSCHGATPYFPMILEGWSIEGTVPSEVSIVMDSTLFDFTPLSIALPDSISPI